MANEWFQFGIQSKDGTNNVASSSGYGMVGAWGNLRGGAVLGSVPLTDSASTYRHLVCTTKGGTQIYIEISSTIEQNVRVYHPDERVNVRHYSTRMVIRKTGVGEWIEPNTYSFFASTIAGTNDYRNYLQRSHQYTPRATFDPDTAFPLGGVAGIQQYAAVCTSGGISFYKVGDGGTYTSSAGTYKFENRAEPCGTIPLSILNNTDYFNPAEDGLPEELADINTGVTDSRTRQYDYPGEDVGFPELPSDNILGLGHYNIFTPSNTQTDQVLDCLWFNPSEGEGILSELIETIKRFIFKPLDGLVSLMLTPVNVTGGSSAMVYLGNFKTNVSAPKVSSQWQVVDCGELNVPLKYGSVLDYSPYVNASIFLPFVGFRSLNVDQISGGKIAIKYYIDMLTGSGVCFMRITDNLNSNNSVLYSYDCNVAMQVPVSSDKYDALVGGLMHMGAQVASAGMSKGGFSGSDAANIIPTAMDTAAAANGLVESGSLSCNTGMLGEFKPYLILEQPVQSLASGYEGFSGFPSNITARLAELTGYTEIEKIHLNINATAQELTEIENLLTSGVIL